MTARKVLIIEDNRDTAESMRFLLKYKGYAVRVAYTGPDGLRLAHEWQPDTILCDIGLPGLNGYEIAEQLRQDPETAFMCLIAITGYGTRQDHERACAAGFDYFYTKPADLDVLFGVLASA
jgi:CheY-like chemotaxis protein